MIVIRRRNTETTKRNEQKRSPISQEASPLHLPIVLGIAFVAVPVAAHIIMLGGLREAPIRSTSAARFILSQGSPVAPSAIALLALALYCLSGHGRDDTLYLVIVLSSLLGARIVASALLRTFERITFYYLDPEEWLTPSRRGERWRYEMRQRFIDDPEYVDALVMKMLPSYDCYADFAGALRAGDFPSEYRDVLAKHYWGPMQQSVRTLASKVVPTDVFANQGRFSAHKTPDEIFDELRALSPTDNAALMDRWQYYWCLRNLNLIDTILRRVFGAITNLAVVFVGMVVFAGGILLVDGGGLSADLVLRAGAVGALLWLIVVCSGSSLIVVRVFRGTGTFAISDPCRGTLFDPLWSDVIKIGIVSFAISFVIYGIGSPFVLDPGTLAHFRLSSEFVVYAAGSFLFCALVFANHTSGVHDLMLGSRTNALDRVGRELADRSGTDQRALERFKELRELRVWPLRGTTLAQIAAGIFFPVIAQAILLYAGLSGH